ncbi:MAG: hypothetical protein KDB71_11830 [Mycobacterium sp.]|nr:hypothetical protein [Mycobacterium sp.]
MKFVNRHRRAALLTGALLTAGTLFAPTAYADPGGGGVPGPGDPVPWPAPGGVSESDSNGCQGSEVRVDGNCIPGAGEQAAAGPQQEEQATGTTDAFENPVDNMPNINGDPCEGQWVSVVCYAEGNVAPVDPHSEISASP